MAVPGGVRSFLRCPGVSWWPAHCDVRPRRVTAGRLAWPDILADIVGCKPTMRRLRSGADIVPRLYATPFAPVQYRLTGPHARPRESRGLIRSAPWTGDGIKAVDLVLSGVLSSLGAADFAASLTLGRHRPRGAGSDLPTIPP